MELTTAKTLEIFFILILFLITFKRQSKMGLDKSSPYVNCETEVNNLFHSLLYLNYFLPKEKVNGTFEFLGETLT